MHPLSPALFLAAASALVASDEREQHARRWQRRLRTELDPLKRDTHRRGDSMTTAAFIAHVGYWAHRATRGLSSWPFPLDADCDALARIGLDCGVIGVGRPEAGSVCLRWSRVEQRFTRASVVVEEPSATPQLGTIWGYDCDVLEGSAVLSRFRDERGDAVGIRFKTTVRWARRARAICCPGLGDRFLNWVDLDARNETTRARHAA